MDQVHQIIAYKRKLMDFSRKSDLEKQAVGLTAEVSNLFDYLAIKGLKYNPKSRFKNRTSLSMM